MSGKVYLVGAGPGDPGLLTLRAAELLGEADVVVMDALAPDALLVHARDSAETLRAGKRYGDHSMSQAELNELLVSLAREGKTVVRLKGGDPFVFGRGGEECEALARAGIAFEVVPGVTSAVAVPAYAGIPLTHRDYAKSFAVVTGHVGAHDDAAEIRWDKLALGAGTIVFLMGVTMLEENTRALLAAGRSPETPVAVIEWGTTPRQRTVVGTLSTIVGIARDAGVAPPAVAVVGDVVKLRPWLGWFEEKPLFGKRVLVTRARRQARDLTARLARLGAEPIAVPTIQLVPPESYEPLDRALRELERYDYVVFTSQNGVEHFWKRLEEKGFDTRRLGRARVAAIGPATADALRTHGVRADLVAREFRAEVLAGEMVQGGVAGARVLVVRAAQAREVLIEELRGAGATVDIVPAYRTVIPAGAAEEVRRVLGEGVHAVTFTSASTVDHFCGLLGDEDARRLLANAVVACIGPITRDAAAKRGLACAVVPATYTIAALCDALAEHFAARRRE